MSISTQAPDAPAGRGAVPLVSKAMVTRLFLGAVVAFVAGWVIAIGAVVAALVGGAVVFGGPTVLTVNGGAFASALGVLAIASVLVGGGTVAAVASWIGALLNTARIEDKTWFVVLLVLGLWSFGFVAMIAYVFAGPDGTRQDGATYPGAERLPEPEARR